MIKKFAALLCVVLAFAVLTACGGDDEPSLKTHTAADGSNFNDADVTFATEMIQHHAQALTMVDMAQGRELDPEVVALVEGIREAQAPEIEQMVDWLTGWDKPIPETSRDHAHAHGDMEMDADMPGMMSADDMAQLEAASGADFQRMWLEMMIEHHEGAIKMAKTEQERGVSEPAVELAKAIASSQDAEIATMKDLLDS
ncbi:uncharacterized protein (DUF305 family) [Nocardioides daedukensis]|uniref:Uncharacterized protein (DUF305 family) n=1 Tax=Nocardioides daedukensis TaxID=634462 RepID=A0A7Y9S4Q4_9ACTN|nr:DUF305 domain-containing protein [Nocardioides daedukensis]NYG60527.1 uncharacterized protein (DUF305 family) [Nocardioides daedukensis]